jgi:hypothetical protein
VNDIFISYRREDSAAICGRIFESLERYLGRGVIFKDVDSIPYGVSFPEYLGRALESASVILIVIGPNWLSVMGENRRRRIDDPADFVRVEIETALRHPSMLALPILVEGATMPSAERLPPSLRPLTHLNAAVVRNDPDYQGDIQRVQTAAQAILLRKRRGSTTRPANSPNAASAAKYAPKERMGRGLLLALITLMLLVVIAGAVALTAGLLSTFSGLGAPNSPDARSAIRTTITRFCQALHDHMLDQAYTYLSPHLQQTITSATDVPQVTRPFGDTSDCSEAQGGSFFTSDDSATAHDLVAFTVTSTLGTTTISENVKFVKSGGAWLIDSIAT